MMDKLKDKAGTEDATKVNQMDAGAFEAAENIDTKYKG